MSEPEPEPHDVVGPLSEVLVLLREIKDGLSQEKDRAPSFVRVVGVIKGLKARYTSANDVFIEENHGASI